MTLFTYQNLYNAYLDCRKRKRNTANALKFEQNLEANLFQLLDDLKNRKYQTSTSISFIVEEPVIREIFAGNFRDRIVHHLLVRYIEKDIDKRFIYDSYACRKEKGGQLGKVRVQKFANVNTDNYYLKLDIQGFFMHINKDIMFDILEKHILKSDYEKGVENELLYLIKVILFSDPTKNFKFKGSYALKNKIPKYKSLFHTPENCGIPIGNLTSQFFANVYLNELDQFVKRELKIKYYGRYVDDFILFHGDKEYLKACRNKIDLFLKTRLKVKLHPRKQILQDVKKGFGFVGFYIKPNYSVPLNKNFLKIKDKFFKINHFLDKKGLKIVEIDSNYLKRTESQINSYLGFISTSKSYNLRKHLFKDFGDKLKLFYKINKDYKSVKFENYKKMTIKSVLERVKKKDDKKLVLFVIGNFYKAYNEHCITLNKVTNCKIVFRKPHIYAGFPKQAEDKFFEILKENNVSFMIMKKNKDTEEYDTIKNFDCENAIDIATKEEFETKYQIMFEKKNSQESIKEDIKTIKSEVKKVENKNLEVELEENILEIIKSLELATLTPLKAFEIVVKLKQSLNESNDN